MNSADEDCNSIHGQDEQDSLSEPVFKRIFEYFSPNIDFHIRFVVILNAEYYSNIQIFCPNIFEYWYLKIRGNAGIKEVLFSFFT